MSLFISNVCDLNFEVVKVVVLMFMVIVVSVDNGVLIMVESFDELWLMVLLLFFKVFVVIVLDFKNNRGRIV